MKYTIKDADGNVTNTIKSSAEFVEANYEHYELFVEPTVEAPTAAEAGRMWRNGELTATDHIPAITDHPQRAAYITYRAALRDWPASDDFPATRPTLGS